MEQVSAKTTQSTFTTSLHHSAFKMHHDHFSASYMHKTTANLPENIKKSNQKNSSKFIKKQQKILTKKSNKLT